MLYNGHVAQSFPLLAIALLSVALAACEANVEEGCITGPCGPETAPSQRGTGSAGGSDGNECSTAPDTGAFPCPVYEVLKARCNFCHTSPPVAGAPFSLLTYEDTLGNYGNVTRVASLQRSIETDYMPLGEPKLAAEQKQTLLDWLGSCALPASDGAGCECTDPAACP
jgi:hypothetical protein